MLDRTTDFYVKGNATQTTSNKNRALFKQQMSSTA